MATAGERRDEIVQALRALGGEVTDAKGGAAAVLLKKLGSPYGPEALRKHLVALERAGIVTRETNGRLCNRISLVDVPPRRLGGRPRGPRIRLYGPTASCRYWRVVFRDDTDRRRERKFSDEDLALSTMGALLKRIDA